MPAGHTIDLNRKCFSPSAIDTRLGSGTEIFSMTDYKAKMETTSFTDKLSYTNNIVDLLTNLLYTRTVLSVESNPMHFYSVECKENNSQRFLLTLTSNAVLLNEY